MLIDLGKKIQELREDNDLTQLDLCDVIGINFKILSKWEVGEYIPNGEELLTISKFFDVPFEDLMKAYLKEADDQEEQEEEDEEWKDYLSYLVFAYPSGVLIFYILFTIAIANYNVFILIIVLAIIGVLLGLYLKERKANKEKNSEEQRLKIESEEELS